MFVGHPVSTALTWDMVSALHTEMLEQFQRVMRENG